MTPRYVVAPRAAKDLVQIWRYVKSDRSREIADRIEAAIRSKFALLADFPSSGHTDVISHLKKSDSFRSIVT